MDTSKNNLFRLLHTIGDNDLQNDRGYEASEELYNYAYKNKVALLYLEALKKRNALGDLEKYYIKNINRNKILFDDLSIVSNELNKSNIDYSFIKTLRYFPENPNDIDIIVFGDSGPIISRIVENLENAGYRKYSKGNNKYNINKIGKIGFWDYKRPIDNPRSGDPYNYFDLDFYLEIMVEEFVHGNKDLFAEYRVEREFVNQYSGQNIKVNVLSPGAELFFLFFHSIFPTRTIGLELYFSTQFLLREFGEKDFRIFDKLSSSTRLVAESVLCVKHLQRLYEYAFGKKNEKLTELGKCIGIKKTYNFPEEINYPYIFPLFFFIKAGIKSIFHKKGIISFLFVILKCFNPFYSYNILKEIISRKLTSNRYASKFHNS